MVIIIIVVHCCCVGDGKTIVRQAQWERMNHHVMLFNESNKINVPLGGILFWSTSLLGKLNRFRSMAGSWCGTRGYRRTY